MAKEKDKRVGPVAPKTRAVTPSKERVVAEGEAAAATGKTRTRSRARAATEPAAIDHADAVVAQLLRELPDLDARGYDIAVRLDRLSLLMTRRADRALEREGLSRGEADVLLALRRAGRPYRVSPGELARLLTITTGGMTGRLTALAAAGLIERVPHPTDGRGSYAQLTPAGVTRAEAAATALASAYAGVADALGAEATRRVGDDLRSALRTLEARGVDVD